ncbi:MAG TPA: NBR1-Ig-like domain-containing protein, partial [Anaerolineales bacterium]|nr:NBR1-Ig-like domain-containing protein [Anaerolineales bacterium]
ASNTAFTKTWRLKNTGTCTWDNNYLVAYISGTTMSQQPGYWIVQQGQTVVPGQTVDVSVGMTAPVDSGNYASYWGLKKVDGQFMPIQRGANGTSFYVKIKVNNGVAEGKITAQSISIELEQGSGTVCTASATYFVHASITADGATTATYEVGSTAGQIPAGYFYTSPTGPVSLYATGVVVFDQAGAKTIDLRFVGPYPYPDDITVNLRVNGGEWYNTELSCQ